MRPGGQRLMETRLGKRMGERGGRSQEGPGEVERSRAAEREEQRGWEAWEAWGCGGRTAGR